MAKDIPRNTLKQLVRDYKSNKFAKPSRTTVYAKSDEVIVFNSSNATFITGSPVKISDFKATLSYDKAASQMINGELILNGIAPSSTDDATAIAVALEPIKARSVGRVRMNNLVFMRVHRNAPASGEAEHQYATATAQTATSGCYKILAKSQRDSSDYMICALSVLLSGGAAGTLNKTFGQFVSSLDNLSVTSTLRNSGGTTQADLIINITASGGNLVVTTDTLSVASSVNISNVQRSAALTNVTLS